MKNLSILNRVTIIIIVIIVVLFFALNKISSVATPILMIQAKENAYNIVTKTINNSVNKVVTENLVVDELFIMTYNNNGEIISIDFDSLVINKILTLIALEIENDVNSINQEVYEIPFGVIFKNTFLTNIGPQIPVKVKLVGSIINDIETEITNYGINNALIEIYANTEVNIQVVLPFISERITVTTLIPIALKLIRGNVPEYYSGSNSNPLLSVPIE